MQKTRIDNILHGRENMQGDGNLISMVANGQVGSLPIYNGPVLTPLKRYQKKDRYHQVAAIQVNIAVLQCIETLANEVW
jgi:hypothetical protein